MAKPTRSQLIGHLVQQAVLQHRLKWSEYAGAVVAHYHNNVEVLERAVSFHVATSPENFDHASRLNTQTIKRTLIGEQRLVADLEESLIAALPQAAADAILMALLDRQGLLLARKPGTGSAAEVVRAPCELLRTAAAAVERIAPMLADHEICPKDAPHFDGAVRALEAVIGTSVSVLSQIHTAKARAAAAPNGAMH